MEYKVYHGTNHEFDRFDMSKSAQGIIWFTDSIDSIKNGEHGAGNKYILTRYITLNNPAGWPEYEKYSLGELDHMGYDGVILPHGDGVNDYIVFYLRSIRKHSAVKEENIIKEAVRDIIEEMMGVQTDVDKIDVKLV